MRTGKAVREDYIGGELHRSFPGEFARLLHPVFTKAALRSFEPRLWRGSLVRKLPEDSKDMSQCAAYRDIPPNLAKPTRCTMASCVHTLSLTMTMITRPVSSL